MALTGLILGTSTGFAATPTAIDVQTRAETAALNGSGATYGPPANATFAAGPFTITCSDPFPTNLRADVFGDSGGLIVGNAANSGAEGITTAPVPEPNPMALCGVATIGLMGVMVVRHRRHHCKRA
jgi:hypothetical protein